MSNDMKVIIAGGRDYQFEEKDYRKIDTLRERITEIVSGCAKGADTCGEKYAEWRDIPVKKFPAQWKDLEAEGAVIRHGAYGPYNANAGFQRNIQMAEYADALAVFPGGRGTDHMLREATKRGLEIFDFR